MTITAPPETTTVGRIIDAEEGPCAGETFEKGKEGVIELGYLIAGEVQLPRVLEAVA
jgi:hypothetical protein